MLKRLILQIICLAGAAYGPAANAGTVAGYPTNWRLENYLDGQNVVLWYTGAAGCTDGKLIGNGMTQDEYNRLFSLILTAKVVNKSVGLFYNGSGNNCVIASFYIEG
tara:strand:- start:7997 stop:8317 length:321 start_codon:yes stop_codon:yes gene_type:complete